MGEYAVNQFQLYNAKAVFISSGAADSNQTISGSIRQLSRVQDVNWDISYPVEQVTYLDAGDEAYLGSHNPIDVEIGYWHTNGRNEQALGLVDTVGVSGSLALNLDQEKNLYISMENTPGRDAVGNPTSSKTILAIGQALMTSYAMSAQVGSLIRSRATMNGLIGFIYTGTSGNAVPAVNPYNGAQLTGRFVLPTAFPQYDPDVTGFDNPIAAAAIGAQDMFLTFPQGTPFGVTYSGAQACYLQGFDVTLTFERRELKPLGAVYPPTRAVFYPIRIDLTTNAIVNRYQRDQLDRIDCLGSGQSVNLIVKQPCSNATLFGFYFDKLQIESQSFTSSIGDADVATTKWRGLITSPNTVFFNPWVGGLYDLTTNTPWGLTW